MIPALSLAIGLGVFSVLQNEKEKRTAFPDFYFRLAAALIFLLTVDLYSAKLLWIPLRRPDLRWLSLFLIGAVLERPAYGFRKLREKTAAPLFISQFSIFLMVLALWLIENSHGLERFFEAGLLCGGTAFVEWLLRGLQQRLRFSSIPAPFQGAAPLLWLAMILALAGSFVNF